MDEDAQREVTTTATPSEPSAKQGGFKFFAATLFLVGVVSVGAQFAAASTNGISEYVTVGPLTGPGLIAIIAGIVMGAKCQNWESWRKWIWLPLIVAVTLVFVVMGFTAQSFAREAAAEEARQAEIAQACLALAQQIEAKAAEIDDLRAAVKSWDRPSWATDSPPWAEDSPAIPPWAVTYQEEYDQLRAEYDERC